MSLEFSKLVDQVRTMGAYLGHRAQSVTSKLETALAWYAAADDAERVREWVRLVRAPSVSGYRGAAHVPPPHDEAPNLRLPPGPMPAQAALIAADGSQIYPDPHGAAIYYLTNIGVFTTFYGLPFIPEQATLPELAYTEKQTQDHDGRTVTNPTINMRRTVREIGQLAEHAHLRAGQAPHATIVALHDGGLLKFFSPTELTDAAALEKAYLDGVADLYGAGAILAGYVSRTRSSSVISLLHLLQLEPDEISDDNLRTSGAAEGVTDADLFARVLRYGERSALYSQNSPQNLTYRRLNDAYEIAYFYLNVGDVRPQIARVEIPMWVARDPAAVATLQAVLVAQCEVQGREKYPYAMTRADELAFVKPVEKSQLDEMVRIAMRQAGEEPERSTKLESKGMARAGRRMHRVG
jgi:hypothetical protein